VPAGKNNSSAKAAKPAIDDTATRIEFGMFNP